MLKTSVSTVGALVLLAGTLAAGVAGASTVGGAITAATAYGSAGVATGGDHSGGASALITAPNQVRTATFADMNAIVAVTGSPAPYAFVAANNGAMPYSAANGYASLTYAFQFTVVDNTLNGDIRQGLNLHNQFPLVVPLPNITVKGLYYLQSDGGQASVSLDSAGDSSAYFACNSPGDADCGWHDFTAAAAFNATGTTDLYAGYITLNAGAQIFEGANGTAIAYIDPVLSFEGHPEITFELSEGFKNASSGRTLPTFGAAGGGGGAVPEPGAWALMLGGFGLAGGALRAKRRRVVNA